MLTSTATIRQVAQQVGLKPSKLEDGLTLNPLLKISGTHVETLAPLLEISVEGTPANKVAAASNELARRTKAFVSGYAGVRLSVLLRHLAFDQAELKAVKARSAAAYTQQQALLKDKS